MKVSHVFHAVLIPHFRHLLPYRQNLIEKIGQDRFDKLELNIQLSKRTGYKWDRFYLLEIIEKYKALNR